MTPSVLIHYAENRLKLWEHRLQFSSIAGIGREQLERIKIQRDKYKSIIEQAEKEN